MSSDEEEYEILDLTKMEDVFVCLEIVAMAQAMLSSVDQESAAELEKVTEALGALSVRIDQGELVQVIEKQTASAAADQGPSPEPVMPPTTGERGIDDLVEFVQGGKSTEAYHPPSDEDDSIVDILTGEKLR
ncbi:MAG: hypothetical protein C0613_12115 [Desulfobulbaceae bacterium]|nr:MAG: hypothetical protein C0613_12115 [Desulfobulbaceae bacterium]